MKRALLGPTFALLWVFTVNHCLISAALASNSKSMDPHHCCGEKNGKDTHHDDNVPAHSGCGDHNCCQPTLKASGINPNITPVCVQVTSYPVSTFFSQLLLVSGLSFELPLIPDGSPPGPTRSLIYSLERAPNAPPCLS